MYGCKCDNCGETWKDEHNGFVAFTDKISMENVLGDEDGEAWHTDRSKTPHRHYCDDCWSIDDNDKLILNPDRRTIPQEELDKFSKLLTSYLSSYERLATNHSLCTEVGKVIRMYNAIKEPHEFYKFIEWCKLIYYYNDTGDNWTHGTSFYAWSDLISTYAEKTNIDYEGKA